jgi:hypothetical protein
MASDNGRGLPVRQQTREELRPQIDAASARIDDTPTTGHEPKTAPGEPSPPTVDPDAPPA